MTSRLHELEPLYRTPTSRSQATLLWYKEVFSLIWLDCGVMDAKSGRLAFADGHMNVLFTAQQWSMSRVEDTKLDLFLKEKTLILPPSEATVEANQYKKQRLPRDLCGC